MDDIETGEAGVDRESDMEDVEGDADREEGSNVVWGCDGVVGCGERCDPDAASPAVGIETT
jgi:hypothetical protein